MLSALSLLLNFPPILPLFPGGSHLGDFHLCRFVTTAIFGNFCLFSKPYSFFLEQVIKYGLSLISKPVFGATKSNEISWIYAKVCDKNLWHFWRIQSQSVSKASARPIFDFWAQMEARTENMSDINLIKHANPQLLSPNTGCLDKIQQFWPTRCLDTLYLMASLDCRDHKVDQVEIALMGPPW